MGEIVDEDGDGLGRVPGRLQDLQAHLAELEDVAVGQRRELVFRLRPRAQVNARPHPLAQLEVAGHEVGVEVRQDDVLDAEPLDGGVLQVLFHVASGIDHDGRARDLVADEIGRLRETPEVVLLEDHVPPPAEPLGPSQS